MRMIPEASVLIDSNLEPIRKFRARGDGVLCKAHGAIHEVRISHVQTMPMNGKALIVLECIFNLDDEQVAETCFNRRSRESTINKIDPFLDTVRQAKVGCYSPAMVNCCGVSVDMSIWPQNTIEAVGRDIGGIDNG